MVEPLRVDCGGVPFFWVEAPPPYRVALQFRVGRADESLPATGVTHLCEHLALSGLRGVPYLYNGRAELNRTIFMCQATAEQSRTFLENTCRRLSRLPVDTLEREKRILLVEAAGRQRGIVDAMLFDRFGARTYGLSWPPELGMWGLDADSIREWAGRWFTRGNAIGWVVGPEPLVAELPLPDGCRALPPAPVPRRVPFPAVTRRPARIVGAGTVVPRSPAARLAAAVITTHLQGVLRYEMGSAYHVLPVYLALTADAAYVSMTSELSDSRTEEAVRGFLSTLNELASRGPREDDVDERRAAAVAALDAHGWEVNAAESAAFNELIGSKYLTREHRRAEYLSTSVDAVRAFAGEFLRSVLYQVPPGLDVSLDGATPVREWSSWSVDGVVYDQEATLPGPRERIVLGEEGMTVWVGEKPLTVAWDRLGAMLCWADGGRRLVGEDGFQINVLPTRVKRGRELVAAIDAHVPGSLRVGVGKRMSVPFPPPVRRDPGARRRWNSQRSANTVLSVLLASLLWSVLHRHAVGLTGPLEAAVLAASGLFVLCGLTVGVALRRRAEVSVGGGVDGTEVYDVAAVHQQRLPAGAPRCRSHVRGGNLLAFLALHDLCSDWFTAESGEGIKRLRRREITGLELYEEWGGVLASDMVSDLGNEFLFYALRVRPKDESPRSGGGPVRRAAPAPDHLGRLRSTITVARGGVRSVAAPPAVVPGLPVHRGTASVLARLVEPDALQDFCPSRSSLPIRRSG